MDGTRYLYLHNRKLTWKLIEQVLFFVITVNIRSKADTIFYFSFTHSIFVFRGDRVFQIFLSIICLHNQLFVVWQKWILNFKISYVHCTLLKQRKKKRKTIKIISVLLPIYSIFRVFQFKSVPLLLQNYKIHLWNVSYKWNIRLCKSFIYGHTYLAL